MAGYEIDGMVEWQAKQNPESGYWAATCNELGLCAGGETFEELQSCIEEVVAFLFEDLRKDGDLIPFLEEHGWSPDDAQAASKAETIISNPKIKEAKLGMLIS